MGARSTIAPVRLGRRRWYAFLLWGATEGAVNRSRLGGSCPVLTATVLGRRLGRAGDAAQRIGAGEDIAPCIPPGLAIRRTGVVERDPGGAKSIGVRIVYVEGTIGAGPVKVILKCCPRSPYVKVMV